VNVSVAADWSGPKLEFSLVQAAPLKVSAETLDHIYRLAQEGLTNALRHADASSIKIILDIQQPAVTLEILDDGVSLAQAEGSTGMGVDRSSKDPLESVTNDSIGGQYLVVRCRWGTSVARVWIVHENFKAELRFHVPQTVAVGRASLTVFGVGRLLGSCQ